VTADHSQLTETEGRILRLYRQRNETKLLCVASGQSYGHQGSCLMTIAISSHDFPDVNCSTN